METSSVLWDVLLLLLFFAMVIAHRQTEEFHLFIDISDSDGGKVVFTKQLTKLTAVFNPYAVREVICGLAICGIEIVPGAVPSFDCLSLHSKFPPLFIDDGFSRDNTQVDASICFHVESGRVEYRRTPRVHYTIICHARWRRMSPRAVSTVWAYCAGRRARKTMAS